MGKNRDEELLSSMEERNEWWNRVFSRVAGKAEHCDLAVAIPPMVLGRILTDADRAVALKERLDRVRLEHMKAVVIPLTSDEKEALTHRSPVGTGITVKMEQREVKCPLCDALIIKDGEGDIFEDSRRFWRCNACTWSGYICPVCERQPQCLVHQPYECACGGWDCLADWIRGTTTKTKKKKGKKLPKPTSVSKVSNELFELAAHIRSKHVPSGAEQMATLTGEEMLDIALRVKELGGKLERIKNDPSSQSPERLPPVVYVEQDGYNNVVGVYANEYAKFEYPENGTQTAYEVVGAGKIPGQSIGECECCGDTRRLVRGLCHPCTRTYFEDAERDLKELREKTGGRVWRVVWLNPGTVSTTTRYFWDREDASKFAKKLEDKKITVGVESVTVQKWEK
jgi:hypothetical protein